MNPGTILPTARSLAISDAMHARDMARAKIEGAKLVVHGAQKRTECGETRYYLTATLYAVISTRTFTPKWFQRRDDGSDYATKAPQLDRAP